MGKLKNIDILKKHLILVEEVVGTNLSPEGRKMSCGDYSDCPIQAFAPDKDKDGRYFVGAGYTTLQYTGLGERKNYHPNYTLDETFWWDSSMVYKYYPTIERWIKKRNKEK